MSFASPLWLLALAALPALVAAALLARRRSRRYAIRFPAAATLAQAAGTGNAWLAQLPAILLLCAAAALALALARPRVTYSAAVGQAAVMLVTDHSGSMAADDVQPTRLAAAIAAADSFIDKLPGSVRIGAVAFSSSPDASQAPVADKTAAKAVIDSQQAGGSTDTGDALMLALQLLHASDRRHPPAAIVLLSDGAANAGIDVVGVARQARADRIPIDTVALGTSNGVLQNPDPLAPPVPVPPDPQLMAQIAQASGGRTFTAQDADTLSSIYRGLAARLGSVTRRRDITVWFAIGGLVLLIAGGAAAARSTSRLP